MVWCPFAERNPITNYPGIPFIPGAPKRGILHTTEVAGIYRPRADGSYFGGASPPHFTVDEQWVWQHIPVDRASYALRNLPGGVETNRLGAIQIEIMWKAGWGANWPLGLAANVAQVMRWIEQACGVVARPHDGFPVRPPRLSEADWSACDCWVGHCHVPENDHWDPGEIPLALLFPTAPPPAGPLFTDFEEADMRHYLVHVDPGPPPFYVSQPWIDPGFGRPPTIVSVTPNGLCPARSPIGAHVEDNRVVVDAFTVDEAGNPTDGFDVHVVVA